MRITLSIPDALAHRFQAVVPPQERSRHVSRLIETSLASHEEALVAACQAANQDSELEREIEDWQAFHDEIAEEAP
jgi:metal-responsive CopG/Arc/MetJ family transcriptional regulator